MCWIIADSAVCLTETIGLERMRLVSSPTWLLKRELYFMVGLETEELLTVL